MPAKRNACDREADAAQHRLHERGDDHAERDAANRLRGEAHRMLAVRAGEALTEPHHLLRRGVAVRVEDDRDHDRHQEFDQQHPDTARLAARYLAIVPA